MWVRFIAVGDAGGGEGPGRAGEAAVYLVDEAHKRPATLGIRLLADIRKVLADDDRIATADLIAQLVAIDGAPWAALKGEPITDRILAQMLNKYDVKPTSIRFGATTFKGYTRAGLWDAFERYAPASSQNAEHPEHPKQEDADALARNADVPPVPDVPLLGTRREGDGA